MARNCNVVFQEIREAVAVGGSGADFMRSAALSFFASTSVELRNFDRLDPANRALFIEMLTCPGGPGWTMQAAERLVQDLSKARKQS